MSRSRHHGCGKSCPMCRPWKHGFESELKPSERRRIQPEEKGASESCDSEDKVVGLDGSSQESDSVD